MSKPLRVVVRFYLLAFAISWVGMVPLILGWPGRGWLLGLVCPGVGPGVAAWVVDRETFLAFRVRVGWRWLVGAAVLPLGLVWVGNGFGRGGVWVAPAARGWELAGLVAMALAANIWEETGWRCCGLRRLQEICRPWMAALVVGVLWAGWHVPLFLWPGMGMQRYPFGWWALSSVGTSVVMAWVWNRTGGSIWGVTVYHVATNVFGAGLGVRSYGVKALVDCLAALVLVVWTRGGLGAVSTNTGTGPFHAEIAVDNGDCAGINYS